ncbi:MAG: hypothetical protein Q9162_004083 [Coniocarpon cinnabarinum]
MSPAILSSQKPLDAVIVGQHPDATVDHALSAGQQLLSFDSSIFEHLRSSLKFSSQAHPVNVLLDTLLRPYGDVSDFSKSCVEWSYEPDKAVSHIVLGEAPSAGGQWADDPVIATKDIGTLSYAEQLSLPGYTFADHWLQTQGESLPELIRPSRAEVARYYAQYPKAVGIADSVKVSERIHDISRVGDGFYVASHNIHCKHLVLASGTFSVNLPPPRSLRPLIHAQDRTQPLLVVGSGFTAADIIMTASPDREILHIYNWDPENRPSPLKGCHSQAYPEYAWIYRQMKLAAAIQSGAMKAKDVKGKFSKATDASAMSSFRRRDWGRTYTGFPNAKAAAIEEVSDISNKEISIRRVVKVSITSPFLRVPIVREVGTLQYAAGRRGNLAYLASGLLDEVLFEPSNAANHHHHPIASSANMTQYTPLPSHGSRDPDPWTGETYTRPPSPTLTWHSRNTSSTSSIPSTDSQPLSGTLFSTISGNAFRDRIDETDSMQVAPKVFAIGSLTGDSLVRFAPGGCCVVAGTLMIVGRGLKPGVDVPKMELTVLDNLLGKGKENSDSNTTILTSSKLGRAAANSHATLNGGTADVHSLNHHS